MFTGDVVAQERAHITWCISIVTLALVGGATESETEVGSLSSDFIGDIPTLVFTGMHKDCCMWKYLYYRYWISLSYVVLSC